MGKTHTKRKVIAHIIDNEAIQTLSSVLPTHWTIRPYVPDYGIDLSIEMFKPIADADGIKKYDTLGEHLFAQVKGTQSITKRTICVSQRYNVEKLPPEQTSQLLSSDKPLPCEIIDFHIDTSELLTIQRMGAAVPVVLFVVDTTSHQVFFLCLNDYIDKVILPDDPSYTDKSSKVLHIPTRNLLSSKETSLDPIKFFSKRTKLYSLFQKAVYQDHELQYINDKEVPEQCRYFARILLQMDVWESARGWLPLALAYEQLKRFVSTDMVNDAVQLSPEMKDKTLCERDPSEYDDPGESYSVEEWLRFTQLRYLWSNLANLGRVYEETCREWYLPTWFGIGCIQ